MKISSTAVHRIISVILVLCLLLPGAALAKGKGKKNFDEGKKYEQLQQWDVAAQKFALAVNAEPNNPEYKLHYMQAIQKASLQFLKRGDDLAADGDYEGAWTNYRYAYQYDQSNEIAKLKMNRMMEQQKQLASGGSGQFTTNRVGNVINTSGELPIATRQKTSDVVPGIHFQKGSKFKTIVSQLGKQLGLNVVYDDSIKEGLDLKDAIDLENVTMAKAMDIILRANKCSFELVDRRTILVYLDNGGTTRQRYETLMVKPFYLNNVTANQARAALQIALPPGRTMAPLESGANSSGGNVLIVKATATELQLVQDIIDAIDKNKNEVVLDVDIYEVTKNRMTQIGNQIPTGTDSGFGGVGTYATGSGNPGLASGLNLVGSGGAFFALPMSSIKLLQSKGDNNLLYKTQIHVLDGQENTTTVGSSVPIRTGASYAGSGYYGGGLLGANGQQGGTTGAINGALNGLLGSNYGTGVVDNIQYKDVGLVIKTTPTITTEGYVEVKMEFETSAIAATGSSGDALNPAFTQRKLKSVSRLQDGVTSVVAGVNQDLKNNSRAGVPIVSMVPILGRFLSAPSNNNDLTDIIITVTPHIVRSAGINEKDHLARAAGVQTAGPGPSVEEVVYRAQQEEEQDRRQIAQQIPQPDQINPSLNPAAPGTTQAAAFTQPPRNATQPTVRQVNNNTVNNGPGYNGPANNGPVRAENVANNNSGPVNSYAPPAVQNAPVQNPAANARPVNTPVQQTDLLTSVLQQPPANVAGISADPRNVSAVTLSLSPRPIRQQPGKSFMVAVDVRSQAQMTEANIAINFDPAKLRVKNVRDGGMFGAQPDPTYEVQNGNLLVKFKSPQSAPAMASSGRMILIEFAALAEGSSEIAFNQTTQVSMAGNAGIKPAGSPTQVIISRDGGATVSQ
jgi:general secretion pathway protein D